MNPLHADRFRFRNRLMLERSEWITDNRGNLVRQPPCAVCGLWHPGLDLHEVIITRAAVQFNKELLAQVIMAKWNVVFVGSGECHERAPGLREKLATILVLQYGRLYTLKAILDLGLSVPEPYLAFVNGLGVDHTRPNEEP